MIPAEKLEAVTRGLRAAFGVDGFDDICQITKGNKYNRVYQIVVSGAAYLLRIIMLKNAMLGPERQFTCMRLAAEGGLAPRILYASLDDGLTITDFVEEVPFLAEEARVRMPATLRALHALPPFPAAVSYLDTTCLFLINAGSAAVEGFRQKFEATKLLTDGEHEQLKAWHAQLANAYAQDARDLVSSHNDLFKPDNILFDGTRVWLVDWEAAFLNDRYADLAVVALQIVSNDAEEKAFLAAYFGHTPDEYQCARFYLMQQLAHIFYTMVFLLIGSAGEPVDDPASLGSFSAFQRRFWAGEISLSDNATKLAYGRMHWEQLVENTAQPRFRESLRIVSQAH